MLETDSVEAEPRSGMHWACLKSLLLSLEDVSTTCGSGWVRSHAATAESPRKVNAAETARDVHSAV